MFWLLLAACEDPIGPVAEEGPEAYVGAAGSYLELGPPDDPNGLGWLLQLEEDAWTLREGEAWITADEVFAVAAEASKDGLVVGGTRLLPDSVEEGTSADGVEVLSRDEVEVYYGTFPDAITVAVDGGDWAGEQVFARDVGLVSMTYQGVQRELRYYE